MDFTLNSVSINVPDSWNPTQVTPIPPIRLKFYAGVSLGSIEVQQVPNPAQYLQGLNYAQDYPYAYPGYPSGGTFFLRVDQSGAIQKTCCILAVGIVAKSGLQYVVVGKLGIADNQDVQHVPTFADVVKQAC